jgi:hypothetical protein
LGRCFGHLGKEQPQRHQAVARKDANEIAASRTILSQTGQFQNVDNHFAVCENTIVSPKRHDSLHGSNQSLLQKF